MTLTDLEPVWHVLLVERIQTHEFEALGHHVERLVVGFGAQGHLVSANLRGGEEVKQSAAGPVVP